MTQSGLEMALHTADGKIAFLVLEVTRVVLVLGMDPILSPVLEEMISSKPIFNAGNGPNFFSGFGGNDCFYADI